MLLSYRCGGGMGSHEVVGELCGACEGAVCYKILIFISHWKAVRQPLGWISILWNLIMLLANHLVTSFSRLVLVVSCDC